MRRITKGWLQLKISRGVVENDEGGQAFSDSPLCSSKCGG